MKTRIVPVQNIARLTTAADALIHRAHGVPGMGLVEGEPGLGKTTAITWLINKCNGIYVRALATFTPAALLGKLLEEVSRSPRGSCSRMCNELMQALTDNPRPIFIDEADYIIDSRRMVDTLRDIHDMTGVPVVLIGMKGIGTRLAHLEQLHSRLMQKVIFQPCDLADTQLLADSLCEVRVRPDLVERVQRLSGGSARRVVVLLASIEAHARTLALAEIGEAEWQKGAEVLGGGAE